MVVSKDFSFRRKPGCYSISQTPKSRLWVFPERSPTQKERRRGVHHCFSHRTHLNSMEGCYQFCKNKEEKKAFIIIEILGQKLQKRKRNIEIEGMQKTKIFQMELKEASDRTFYRTGFYILLGYIFLLQQS